MKIRLCLGWTLAVLAWAATGWGQAPAGPNQPVAPQVPTFQARGVPQQQALQVQEQADPGAPFQLTPQEQANLDGLLQAWEQSSARIKTFQCSFTRFEYNKAFAQNPNQPTDPNKPNAVSRGELRYAAPDRGRFAIEGSNPAPPELPVSPELWICDGKSIHQYDYTQKRVTEFPLPPGLQGQAIADSPLPFLFGSSAAKLKQRYYLRLITPANVLQEEVWLEAWPRYQADRANMVAARLILKVKNLEPFAVALYLPDKSRQNYVFENIQINRPGGLFERNPFEARVPKDWVKVVDNSAQTQAQAGQEQPGGARR